jgi:hypothetical protein
MSIEDDLRRQLHAKAAAVKAAPDLGDLLGRIGVRERRARRHERLALGAAVIVLAASLGGLAGALVSVPRAKQSNGQYTRAQPGQAKPSPQHGTAPKKGRAGDSAPTGPRTIISQQAPSGVSVVATVQPFASPVAIASEWGTGSLCATGEIVTTTVGESGSFGGGTSVAELPKLTASGLEILSSGVLQVANGGQEWWVTAAVGSGVARVAAENVGGTPVTVTPSAGIAVIAGAMSGSDSGSGEMSAVAEGGAGDESLGFLLGSGPRAVGASAAGSDATGCSRVVPQAGPSSASSSQPAQPELAAGSIVAAFDQAYSANPLLGFAANLAAVDDGGRLSAAPASRDAAREVTGGPTAFAGGAATSGGAVEVRQVMFLSASVAEVVYRINGSVLLTGLAELGSGVWRVSLATFCDNLGSRLVGGDVPAGVIGACEQR